MMSRKVLLLASIGLASLHVTQAQFCSALCNTCCPVSANSDDVLEPSPGGDCISRKTGQSVCALETGRCLGGTAPKTCAPVPFPRIELRYRNIGPNAGRPVDTVTTFLTEGAKVWDELVSNQLPGKLAQLHDLPPIYHQAIYAVPKATKIEKDATLHFRCAHGNTCNVVVFLYECFPCVSAKGGLPALLTKAGFSRSRCAPAFTNGRTDTKHKMTAYVKSLPVDGEFEFEAEEEIEFALFGMTFTGTDCDSLDGTACDNTNGFCTYRGGRCMVSTCVQMGPGGGCNTDTCVKKELA